MHCLRQRSCDSGRFKYNLEMDWVDTVDLPRQEGVGKSYYHVDMYPTSMLALRLSDDEYIYVMLENHECDIN